MPVRPLVRPLTRPLGRPGGGFGAVLGGGGGDGGSNAPAAVPVDPPITTSLIASSQIAFGFDRLVQGFAGNTIRLQKTTGPTQADFGFTSATGIFDLAAVVTWAAGDAVTVVKFYDQLGGAKTLDANTATSIAFVTGGLAVRFATAWSAVDGQITQSTTQGGVGCSVTGGGYFNLATSGLSLASDLEFHVLAAPFQRKKATAVADPTQLNATNTSQAIFSYGTSATNYFRYIYGGGTAPGIVRRNGSGAGGTDQQTTVLAAGRFKQNSANIFSCSLTSLTYSCYGQGRKMANTSLSAGNITANGSLGNGQFRIGEGYATGTAGNMLFGGVIVTNTLADNDRTYVHYALNAIGQSHRRISTTALMAKFDELIDTRYVDGNGLVVGRKNQTSIQFNKTTGSPTFDFAYVVPDIGWTGIRSPSNTNVDNTYKATNNYFTDVQTGSMMAVCANENTAINQTFVVRNDGDNSDFSVGLGRHHTSPNMYRAISAAQDTQSWTRHLYSDDGGDGGGGVMSQAMCKYQFNLGGDWTPGGSTLATITSVLLSTTIIIGTSLTTAVANTVGWYAPTPEQNLYADQVDLKFTSATGELLFHMASFQKGPSYNPTDLEAVRRLYMRTATNYSYIAHHDTPVAHRDASILFDAGTGSIAQSESSWHIQSDVYQGDVNKGTHIFWGFAKMVWTQQDVEEIQVNLPKLIYSGYPA